MSLLKTRLYSSGHFLGGFILFSESIVVTLPNGKCSMAVVSHTRVTDRTFCMLKAKPSNEEICKSAFIHLFMKEPCVQMECSLDPTPQDSEKCDWS